MKEAVETALASPFSQGLRGVRRGSAGLQQALALSYALTYTGAMKTGRLAVGMRVELKRERQEAYGMASSGPWTVARVYTLGHYKREWVELAEVDGQFQGTDFAGRPVSA